jgi:DNA-binding NtrC family response regulator
MTPARRTSTAEYKRVILVEDDSDTLLFMRTLLQRMAVTAVPASTCESARRAAEALGGIDLVITDVTLPDGTGVALAFELASRYGCEIIIVSGTPPGPSLPDGVRMWLTKPIDIPRFRDAVLAMVA